jgi:hypothetical protein
MKSKIFLLLFAIPVNLLCQTIKPDVIASLGGSGITNEFSMNWTLGEVFVEEFSNGDYILAQGFNQGYPGIASNTRNSLLNFEISVYPNPVSDILNIQILDSQANMNWRFEVFDMLGIKLFDKFSNENNNMIDFSSMMAGTYLVRVSHHNYYKIFHITKNDFTHEKN